MMVFLSQTQLTILPTRTSGLSTLLRCKGEKGCNFPVSSCLNLLRFLYKEITLIKSPFCCMKGARWLMFDFGWDWIWEKILTWNNTSSFYNPGLPRVLAQNYNFYIRFCETLKCHCEPKRYHTWLKNKISNAHICKNKMKSLLWKCWGVGLMGVCLN